MFRIDTTNNVLIKPAYPAAGTQGYFSANGAADGTYFSPYWCNMVQEEILAVIEDAGLTASGSDDGQLSEAIALGVAALVSDASDTGIVSTTHTRAVLASSTSKASAGASAVVSSLVSAASAVASAVVASQTGIASGNMSAVVASDTCTASGGRSAALASQSCVVTGTRSAAIASSGSGTVSGDNSVLIATTAGTYDLTADDTLAGAAGGALTWSLSSATGDIYSSNDIDADNDVNAGADVNAVGAITAGGGFGSTGSTLSSAGVIQADGIVETGANFKAGGLNGITTTFLIANGDTVTVKGGIITSVAP